MKKIPFIFITLCFINFANAQINNTIQNSVNEPDTIRLSKETHGYLQVFYEDGEHYDDGVFLTKYGAYHIYDSNNNLLLDVSESAGAPATIKIAPGTYYIKLKSKTAIYEVIISPHITSEFVIPQ